jgi:ParB-like chromosome segregation protein Spo0J
MRTSTTTSTTQKVPLATLGEGLSSLRLCDEVELRRMRGSLAQHGQLTALSVFEGTGGLEVLDGFKRVRAARALGWPTLVACIDEVSGVDAKLRLMELHEGRGLTELEQGWLVRSLHREDRLSQPQIAQRLGRDKSWVWRRLMLVESLEDEVQSQVRLGLLCARAAVAVSRLPRGNQVAASRVAIRRGLTVRQTDHLVAEVLGTEETARPALLACRLETPAASSQPGPQPKPGPRNEAEWMSTDVLRIQELAARLSARLLARPPRTLPAPAAELVSGALVQLSSTLRSLDAQIARVTTVEAP